jgi:hypothetical protein
MGKRRGCRVVVCAVRVRSATSRKRGAAAGWAVGGLAACVAAAMAAWSSGQHAGIAASLWYAGAPGDLNPPSYYFFAGHPPLSTVSSGPHV